MKIIKWLDDNLEEFLLVILLVAMSLIMGVQIVARYVFKNSLTWSEELTRFLFIWSAFIGVAYTTKKRSSIQITNFRDSLPKNAKRFLIIFEQIILIVFFGFLVIKGFNVVNITRITAQKSAAMEIPMWIVQFSVVFGAALAMFRSIQNLIADTRNKSDLKKEESK